MLAYKMNKHTIYTGCYHIQSKPIYWLLAKNWTCFLRFKKAFKEGCEISILLSKSLRNLSTKCQFSSFTSLLEQRIQGVQSYL
jgi:hypothetical protein